MRLARTLKSRPPPPVGSVLLSGRVTLARGQVRFNRRSLWLSSIVSKTPQSPDRKGAYQTRKN